MPSQPIDENDLHAYVDNRLDPARRAEVSRFLEANPEAASRVADWAGQQGALRQALRRNDPLEQHVLVARLTRRRPAPVPWAMAAGIVLALGLGGAGGWFARGERHPTEIARLSVEAATAYRVFANDPVRPVEMSAEQRGVLQDWIAQKLGRRVAVPDLAAMGYHLMGGRVLTAMYGPAAMLLYRDAADNRITVYVQPMEVGEPAAMEKLKSQTVDGYAWISHQIGYSVLSDGDVGRLQSIAHQVRGDARS